MASVNMSATFALMPPIPSLLPRLGTARDLPLIRAGDQDISRALAITAVIIAGLVLDQHLEFWGQTLTNIAVWSLFLHWLRRAQPRDKVALTACIVYATLGEIFLSLAWGLYEYRLANVPLFVPPGHALLFMLGSLLAARAREWITWMVPLFAAPFVCGLAFHGADTFGVLLFALFLLGMLLGSARKLYAVMFVLSLAMEIFGTWLGNWTWSHDVPWLGMTTVNPPLAAGAFYCVLDVLVVATVARMRGARSRARCAPRFVGRRLDPASG